MMNGADAKEAGQRHFLGVGTLCAHEQSTLWRGEQLARPTSCFRRTLLTARCSVSTSLVSAFFKLSDATETEVGEANFVGRPKGIGKLLI